MKYPTHIDENSDRKLTKREKHRRILQNQYVQLIILKSEHTISLRIHILLMSSTNFFKI